MRRLSSHRKFAILGCFTCWIGAAVIACQTYAPTQLEQDQASRMSETKTNIVTSSNTLSSLRAITSVAAR